MKKPFKVPVQRRSAGIYVDPTEFVCYVDQKCLSMEEVGMLVRSVLIKAKEGKISELEKLPFYRGYIRPLYGRQAIPRDMRISVLEAGQCALCGATENLQVDHKIPICKGGPDTLENLQCLCKKCNIKKGGK